MSAECPGAGPIADFATGFSDVDAVVVSSPNFLHADRATLALSAGKRVYCEKPMGLSAAQSIEIRDAARRAGTAFCVGFATRFTRTVSTMLRLQREGKLRGPAV